MRIDLCKGFQDAWRLADALGVTLAKRAAGAAVGGIATDSREVRAGDLFVALAGANTDGARHIGAALSAGAVAALSSALPDPALAEAVMLTPDPRGALLRAARVRRSESRAFLVAVGGSTGKTTVKEAIGEMARGAGSVCATAGNFNSDIGLSLTLLSFEEADRWVVELGINHPNEMAQLSSTAAPDLAVLTNVGTAHIGHFSDFSQLLAEKAQIAAGVRAGGRLLAPAELPRHLFSLPSGDILQVGEGKHADFSPTRVTMSEFGVQCDLICPHRVITNISWPVAGRIGLCVLSTVCAAGVLCGFEDGVIREGIARAGARMPRMREIKAGGWLLIDDTYNASPESVVGALEALAHRAPRRPRVAVLGDMLELGGFAPALHDAVGEAAVKSGISQLLTYGTLARDIAAGARKCGMPAASVYSFDVGEEAELCTAICRHSPPDAAILFKASGRMALGQIVKKIGKEG